MRGAQVAAVSRFAARPMKIVGRDQRPPASRTKYIFEQGQVLRPSAEVEVRLMPSGGAEFLADLMSGKSLTEAAKSAMKAYDLLDVSANLAALISAGIFIGYFVPEHAAWIELEVA
jgi:hypothetical protein